MTLTTNIYPVHSVFAFNFLIVVIVKSGKLTTTFILHQFIQFLDGIYKIVNKEVA